MEMLGQKPLIAISSLRFRGAPIPGICIDIGLIPCSIFDGIGFSLVCYTSTNSVVCALLSIK